MVHLLGEEQDDMEEAYGVYIHDLSGTLGVFFSRSILNGPEEDRGVRDGCGKGKVSWWKCGK